MKKARQPVASSAAYQNTRRAGAILLATGETTDAGAFDPFWTPLAGLPLLAWSVAAFERAPEIAEIVLVVSPTRQPDASALAAAQNWRHTHVLAAPDPHLPALLRLSLNALSPATDRVVIHDAARPLVSPELIAAGLAAVGAQSADAAAASIPVNETLKRVQSGLVVETPPRAQLALLQTPQVFSRAALLAALDAFDAAPARLTAPTDAASLAIAASLRVALFPGAPTNIRVATPAELALAEALLAAG